MRWPWTIPYEDEISSLSTEQYARGEALDWAETIVLDKDNVMDIVAVARWIMDGKDPWEHIATRAARPLSETITHVFIGSGRFTESDDEDKLCPNCNNPDGLETTGGFCEICGKNWMADSDEPLFSDEDAEARKQFKLGLIAEQLRADTQTASTPAAGTEPGDRLVDNVLPEPMTEAEQLAWLAKHKDDDLMGDAR